MGGTRYNSRGINPSGFVSNYVETEQIVDLNKKVYSQIQIRGSVPFYWDQKNVGRDVNFSQSDDINQSVMFKHFQMLRDQFHFKEVLVLNMLSKKKKHERRLGKKLHELYINNFTNNRKCSKSCLDVDKGKTLMRVDSIENSMNVDWLDTMFGNNNAIPQNRKGKFIYNYIYSLINKSVSN